MTIPHCLIDGLTVPLLVLTLLLYVTRSYIQKWCMVLYTVKKGYPFFPSPAGMSLTKLSLAGNNLIIPVQGEFGK
jgi:hypothetical protein